MPSKSKKVTRRGPSNADAADKLHFLDESMCVADLVEILDQLSHRRDIQRHALMLDRGVNAFLLGMLRERLPRQREAA